MGTGRCIRTVSYTHLGGAVGRAGGENDGSGQQADGSDDGLHGPSGAREDVIGEPGVHPGSIQVPKPDFARCV